MDVLMLCYREEPLREFPLPGHPLEVGRAPGCDIVVHDPDVRERHLLVSARQGTVLVHEIARGRSAARPLPPNAPLPVGRHHSLVRLPDVPTRPRSIVGRTEPLGIDDRASKGLSLMVGRGDEARRVALGASPVCVGSNEGCDLRLSDRAVSARHCRLEPARDGWIVRDLQSRNGTYVDGVPVDRARLEAGARIRVGRTDLRLVARGRKGDARDHGLVARDPAMHEVLELVERYGRLSWSTLVQGESGTGKELIARALHERGRAEAPFVAINAGGMPASLVESELFGHERGAFTGASTTHKGVFEQAHGGTLFLDEIGELPLELQARLLRALETWEIRRLGGERSIRVEVRLVCATHRDLRRMVRAGTFRQDLYYRIARLVIRVPPLRERPEDVVPLARSFLARAVEQVGPRRLSREAEDFLCACEWPGNARELRNVIGQAAANAAGAWISREDVASALSMSGPPMSMAQPSFERLEEVLGQHRGNMAAAARTLGMPRTTLRDRLRAGRAREQDERRAG